MMKDLYNVSDFSVGADKCPWMYIFNDAERFQTVMGVAFLMYLPAVTVLSYVFQPNKIFTPQRYNFPVTDSHKHVDNYFTLVHFKSIIMLLTSHITKDYPEIWLMDSCKLHGLVESFLSILETEFLTTVCIERYVAAKYLTKGNTTSRRLYNLFFYLPFAFAFAYSTPPLLGVGTYGKDFTCDSCTFSVILPTDYTGFFVAFIFFLRSVKPCILMVAMLTWAYQLEENFTKEMQKKSDKYLTQIVILVVIINLVGWAPLGLVKYLIITEQIKHGHVMWKPVTFWMQSAVWCHHAAPLFTILFKIGVIYCIRIGIFGHKRTATAPIRDLTE